MAELSLSTMQGRLFRGEDSNYEGKNMNEDPRCCGTGTCIIDPEGFCWCGQQWDGEKMAMPKLELPVDEAQANQASQNQSSANSK
jgi:hypothetical protein